MSTWDATSDVAKHRYEIQPAERVVTPALLIYRDLVRSNTDPVLRLLHGDPRRWRPPVKTAKLMYLMEMLTACGVTAFKCATGLELLMAIRAGARDVLVAYPLMEANARRIREISIQYPQVAISVLVDAPAKATVGGAQKLESFLT